MSGFAPTDVPGSSPSHESSHADTAQGHHCDPDAGEFCGTAKGISARMLRGEMLRNQFDAIHAHQYALDEMKAHLGADTVAALAAHSRIQGRTS